MKQNENTTPKQGHSANMLLYAVAPTPKLSTDSNDLDCGKESRGITVGATSRPILFSAPMVRAILNGTKTQTRRIIKPEPHPYGTEIIDSGRPWFKGKGRWHNRFTIQENPLRYEIASLHDCPFGKVGDKLWVRETFGWTQSLMVPESEPYIVYRATFPSERHSEIKWKPSIFMPRGESRIELTITAIRAERLQDISVEDSLAEGITHHSMNDPIVEYQWLWEKINGRGSWDLNPFVWVIEFSQNK